MRTPVPGASKAVLDFGREWHVTLSREKCDGANVVARMQPWRCPVPPIVG
jgi:hypothetical protein